MNSNPGKLSYSIAIRYHYTLLILFIIGGLLSTGNANAQCYSITKEATLVVDDDSYGNLRFANPQMATPSDNNRATALALLSLLTGRTHYLKASGFGFSIPTDASICGVQVEIEKRAGGLGIGAWVRDDQVRLVKGGTVSGNNMAVAGLWSGTEAYHAYGGSTNVVTTWGTGLTHADVNSSNFGVAVAAEFEGLAILLPSVQVDNIRVTVFLNPVLPTKIISFEALLKNNNAILEWETAEEESHETVILQRIKSGEVKWTDITKYDMITGNTATKYSYTDPLKEKGSYSYRLAITATNNNITYSKIKNIRFEGHQRISVYPNPSNDFIIIDGVKTGKAGSIPITNSFGQTVQLPAKPLGSDKVQVDIQLLPDGMYYAIVGGERTRFLKR